MDESTTQQSEWKNELEQDQSTEKNDPISLFTERLENFRYYMKSHSRPRQQTLRSFVNKESEMVEEFSKIGRNPIKERKSKISGNTITSRVQKSFKELHPSPKKNTRKENIGKGIRSPLGFFGHVIPKKKPIIPLKPSSGIDLERAIRTKVSNTLIEPRIAILCAKNQKIVFSRASGNQNPEREFSESKLPQKVAPYLWIYPSRILHNQVVDEHGYLMYYGHPTMDVEYQLHENKHTLKRIKESYDLEKSGTYFGMSEFPTSDASEESCDSFEVLEAPADEVINEDDEFNGLTTPKYSSILNSSNITRFFQSPKGKRMYAQFSKKDTVNASVSFLQLHNDLLSHGVPVDFCTLNHWLDERNISYV
ncbi:hypothetical protein SPOG_00830 [Schizosaccharomyces cryophilus OY26]|uniref:Uncharacterized protein n=1 Tax=Schizosaccharomyces cryophilus (strain OY26 / ATCC MYA-4695 / CBS 11777 / NBRC 106824 / NRRL Y48691) TaxID=653667 RepID=S9VRS1_SCHCR|nr:uncharacterized protein SPOG_00830 [Schizosaccharomyces cryophilus OY26]EPY50628.1 hypothetical protein SPOG_00830 [Schizosaccharomyces cryophilus OY26]